jgi:hypothetical protein
MKPDDRVLARAARGRDFAPLLALFLLACGDGSAAPGPSGAQDTEVSDAIALCLRTLHGEVALRQQAIDALVVATDDHPDSARAFFHLGMCSLAATVEDGDQAALGRVDYSLSWASKLDPSLRGPRGNLWVVRLNGAIARKDSAAVEEAASELIAAADADPFNVFIMSFGLTQLPLSSGHPATAAKRMEAYLDQCSTLSYCRNTDITRHHDPAMYVHLGDTFARIGDAAKAASYYEKGLAAPGADTWAFADEAKAWAADLPARVALHGDADPTNDPPPFLTGPRSCLPCHQ